MFAVSTYEEVIDHERFVENQEIVVLLFVKPTNQDAMDIVQEFEYIHYNSSKYCSIYAVGYSNDFQKQSDPHYKKVCKILNVDWYFSSKAFVEFKNHLEGRIKWRYSGEIEILILQNNTEKSDPLNFEPPHIVRTVQKRGLQGVEQSNQRLAWRSESGARPVFVWRRSWL